MCCTYLLLVIDALLLSLLVLAEFPLRAVRRLCPLTFYRLKPHGLFYEVLSVIR